MSILNIYLCIFSIIFTSNSKQCTRYKDTNTPILLSMKARQSKPSSLEHVSAQCLSSYPYIIQILCKCLFKIQISLGSLCLKVRNLIYCQLLAYNYNYTVIIHDLLRSLHFSGKDNVFISICLKKFSNVKKVNWSLFGKPHGT